MHHRNLVPRSGQTLYFAYGSNLSFDQMAKRCPGSRFVGRARLYGYVFQINQRGFANIVETSDSREFVDGLCYRLSTNDELALDRSEGVPTAYQKEELEVEFFPAAPDLVGRDVVDIVRNRMPLDSPSAPGLAIPDVTTEDEEQKSTLQPSQFQFRSHSATAPTRRSSNLQAMPGSSTEATRRSSNLQAPSRSTPAGLKYVTDFERGGAPKPRRSSSLSSLQARTVGNKGGVIKAMVYLSRVYMKADRPWDEYIERMRRGLEEALHQGFSTAYVIEIVHRWLRIGKGIRTAMSERPFSGKHKMSAILEGAGPFETASARKRRSARDSMLDSQSRGGEEMKAA